MESMAIIGFVFGLAALHFALSAKREIAKLSQELDQLRQTVETAPKVEDGS